MGLSLFELVERSKKGKKLPEKEHRLNIFKRCEELRKKYNIQWDKKALCVIDDDLAHRAFEAGTELALATGCYNISTGRVISYTRDELEAMLFMHRDHFFYGEGRDMRIWRHRKPEDPIPPKLQLGIGGPLSEDLAADFTQAYAEVPYTDALWGFNLIRVAGREVFQQPLEAHAGCVEMMIMRKALANAHRPGMGICYYPHSTDAAVLVAPFAAGLMRKNDMVSLSPYSHLTIDFPYITAASLVQKFGCWILSSLATSIGTYAGGPEGTAIDTVACALNAVMILGTDYMQLAIGHMDERRFLDGLWPLTLAGQALALRTPIVCGAWLAHVSSTNTRWAFYEVALRALGASPSGLNVTQVRKLKPAENTPNNPLIARFAGEICHAAKDLPRPEANSIMMALKNKMDNENWLEQGKNQEKDIYAMFEVPAMKPKPEYLEIYEQAKSTLEELGFCYSKAL